MKQRDANVLFRTALLLLNIALIGSMAADVHFGLDLRSYFRSTSVSGSENETSKKENSDTMGSEFDLTGQVVPATRSKQDKVRVQQDGSRVNRMEDGYGNSTVTRNFSGHKLLRMMIIRIQADGGRTVFVYGKNGKVKSLPPNLHDRVLAASADEIAAAAKIFDSQNPNDQRKQRITVLQERLREQRREKQIATSATSGSPTESVYEDPPGDDLVDDQPEPED